MGGRKYRRLMIRGNNIRDDDIVGVVKLVLIPTITNTREIQKPYRLSKHACSYKLRMRALLVYQPSTHAQYLSVQHNDRARGTAQWTCSAVLTHTDSQTFHVMLQLLSKSMPKDTQGVCN